MADVAGEDRIGRFRVVRSIYLSQNSAVLEVAEDGTGRRFAVKQLLPGAADDREQRKALESEAKLGQILLHPNLIRVHEFVRDKLQPYYVMDYFASRNLRSALSAHRGAVGQSQADPVPRTQYHRIIEQAAQALAYIHDKGYAHRDVKPENLLINKAGETRVIDYSITQKVPAGLGKLFFRKPEHVAGTVGYIAPEQILKQPPTPSVDIYSLGIVCYELATGRKPFFGNSMNELLGKHLREQPSPPTMHSKEITPEFSDLTLHLIAKRPQDRPESLRDFLSRFSRIRIFQDDPDPQAGRQDF